jgi:superfamily II DNA or RNA helicase
MSEQSVENVEASLGKTLFDYQRAALESAVSDVRVSPRHLLFYKTGAGKSLTALGMLHVWNIRDAVVITPPATFDQWYQAALQLGINIECMSHAKFRMKKTLLSRKVAVIADEFHQFGGHNGQGWKKLDRLALHLQAPLILASATPNYNDAERVYCIQHVLDPTSVRGGYLEFLYQHCNTRQNPFGMEPLVDDDQPFRSYPDAAAYLAALPYVHYLADDLVYAIVDVPVPAYVPAGFETFGLNGRAEKMIASQIEERHARINLALVDDYGKVRQNIYEIFTKLAQATDTPTLVFAVHATVADALGASLQLHGVKHAVVTGGTPAKKKAAYIDAFKDGVLDVLVGTASLATGTDGMDKMCDHLVIFDDTDDDALRRQLIGRIMPRGADTDASKKLVQRLVLQ